MNKKRFIKIISIFLIVLFTCFSFFQLHKTYTKAIVPLAIPLGYGVELLFNIAATAFISNAVYQMGTEAKKLYDDWQDNKNDDEKKAQYGYWGQKLRNSMTSEEVENALNSAVNVIDGAVGLTLSSKSYQEFINNVNKDREKNLSITFKQENSYKELWQHGLSLGGYNSTLSQQRINECKKNNYSYLLAYFYSPYGVYSFLLFVSNNSNPIFWNNEGNNATFSLNDGFDIFLYQYDNSSTELGSQGAISHGSSFSISSLWGKPVSNVGIVEYNAPNGFVNMESPSLDSYKKIETAQPDLEIKANPDYDSEISVSIPTTEISSEQLTESPYKENASNFEYPDSFENVVNNTTINNEYNKNPIKEGNEGLLDYGDTVNLDFSPLYGAVEDKFPFCVPFDLFHAIDTLTAEKEKPEFTITFPSIATSEPVSFTFNFDDYELVIEIFRYFVLLAFCIGLVINTKKILGGS